MKSPLIIQNLVKKYGKFTAVDDISFHIKSGEAFGLLGPNGAGKTSAISCIVGLEKATSGRIEIFGKEAGKADRKVKSEIGIVPQEIVNHGYFNVEEILYFYAGYYGYSRSEASIEKVLKRLQLWDKRHTRVKKLSGGMKRRLLIAKALCHNPQLVILDEPTAGVDVQLRAIIWKLISELKAEGRSILLTTHYLDEAENLCDRVGVIDHGKLLMSGKTADLIKKLTYRELSFRLRDKNTKCTHPQLIKSEQGVFTFRVSSSQFVGDLLGELNWGSREILDISIKEGSLEQAFLKLIKEQK